ncbi:uncharacterized mitochondrial protein AtMg00810-like [Nicotiana tomentosiformis]|uniref:uncharacterized mitochondrial protein AtMg00810-like n=1 Tax=Nicotiana tomentosiformis TaxID=4098 RepID=UPI00388CD2E4
MGSEFEMSMLGELNFFLGLQIKQNPNGTMIHQQKYVKELLKRFKMEDSKEIDTPIATATKLDIDEPGSSVDQKLYRGMIGSLLHLTASRPDIVFSIGLCVRFQENPKESHLTVVKRILRYQKGTTDLCLWYPKGSNFNLVGYADADYAGFLMDRKSTSGMAHFLGLCLASWATKKQNLVALSTAEAEYVVAALCCAQLLRIKQQLMNFGIDIYIRELSVKNLVYQDYTEEKSGGVDEIVQKRGGSGSGKATKGLVQLGKNIDELVSSKQETLADLLKRVTKSYNPKKKGRLVQARIILGQDAEIERIKKRLAEVETERDALRTELTREKENNDGILQDMLKLLQTKNQTPSSSQP